MSIESNRESYREMAVLGFLRGASTFPIEHPLERLKIRAQAKIEKTTVQGVKELWKSQGLKGLYEGSRANFIRRTSRETYTWPVMHFFPPLWKKIIPEKINTDNLISNIATGHSMAFVQSMVELPLQRLVIEKAEKEGYKPFIRKMIASKKPIIYKGFQATVIRHSIVWDLFFMSNHASQSTFRKIDPNEKHPYLTSIGKALMTSNIVVATGYPLEFIRNRILLEPEILSQGTLRGMKTLFIRYKWVKLYSGAPVVFVHNFIQTLFFQPLIEKINKN